MASKADKTETASLSDVSISSNSTVPSEKQEQYAIDGGILAERNNDGEMQYLVKWEGYDEHRNTWEPAQNFQDDETLVEWQETKTRISKGLESPFDISAFEDRVEKIMERTATRKRLRRLKKARLMDNRQNSKPEERLMDSRAGMNMLPETGSVPQRQWTDQERRTFEAAWLKEEGPFWDRILDLHGPQGTINKDLKRMNKQDLQREAYRMKMEFAELQREPPFSLESVAVAGEEESQTAVAIAPRATPCEPELHKSPERAASRGSSRSRMSTGKDSREILEPFVSKKADGGTSKLHQSTKSPSSKVSSPTSSEPGGHLSMRGGGRSPHQRSSTIRALPRPTETVAREAKKQSGQIAPKTKKNDNNNAEPVKLFKNFSEQNKILKKRQNEPAPLNPDSLVLFDPRTGKVTRPSPPPSSLHLQTKSPSNDPIMTMTSSSDKASRKKSPTSRGKGPLASEAPVYIPENHLNLPQQRFSTPEAIHTTDDMISDGPHTTTERSRVTSRQGPVHQNEKPFNPPTGPSASRKENRLGLPQGTEQIMGDLIVGTQNPECLQVRLELHDRALKQKLLTVRESSPTVRFQLKWTLTATEYGTFFPLDSTDDLLGWGVVMPLPHAQEGVKSLSSKLIKSVSGALCVARLFTMLVFPVGSDSWTFLERKLPAAREGAMLRFVVREPLPPEYTDSKVLSHAKSLMQQPPNGYEHILTSESTRNSKAHSKGISTVFEELYGIDYDRLKSDKEPNFFLIFIPAGCESYEKDPTKRQAIRSRVSEEHDLFAEFLQANGATVFSMQNLESCEMNNNGSWDYFVNNVKSGTLVIHDACSRIDQIAGLANIIYQFQIGVWKFSLEPLEDARHPHLIRLFPHGAVILLTESLMLYRPYEALRILMWFRLIKNHRDRVPDTWKLAVRVHIRPWLLDILDLYKATETDVFGCGKQVFGDIYANITWLLEKDFEPDGSNGYLVPDGMMCYEWDSETPDEEAPIVAPSSLRDMRSRNAWKRNGAEVTIDHANIKKDDDLLIQWFAEWATSACENYRRFQVVLGHEASTAFDELATHYRRWGHLEIVTAEKCYKRQNIDPQAELDAREAKRLDHHRKHAPHLFAKIDRTRATERHAAAISLERMKAMYRDAGAGEKQVREGVRLHLRQTGASLKEIREVEIDMGLRNEWNEGLRKGLGDEIDRVEEIERILEEERVEEERAEREDRERVVRGRERVSEWISHGNGRGVDGDDGGRGGGGDALGAMDVDVDIDMDGDGDVDVDGDVDGDVDVDVDMDGGEGLGTDGTRDGREGEVQEDAVARSIRLAREFPLQDFGRDDGLWKMGF